MFTGVNSRQSDGIFNMINRGVMVTMQQQTTMGTRELSLTEGHINPFSTTAAPMTATSCSRILDKLSTACYGFVGQHLNESIPRSIRNAFCQPTVLNHTFDVKVFNSDDRISINEFSAKLVKEIGSLVSDSDVLPCQEQPCLSPIHRPLLLSANPSLQEFQSLFRFNQESRIVYNFSIVEGGEVFETDINTNLFFRGVFGLNIRQFAAEDGKPLSNFINLNGEGFDLASWNPMQDDRNTSYPIEPKPFVRQKLKTTLGKSDAVHPALKSWKTLLLAGFVFNPAKEVAKSLMNPVRDILFNLRMKFRILARERLVVIKLVERDLSKLPRIYTQSKKLIIDCFASFKRINQSSFLFVGRIQTIFEHLLNNHRGVEYV